MDNNIFAGKSALVTGAAGGMGGNIACDLLAAGAYVTMLDIEGPKRAIDQDNDHAQFLIGDAVDEDFAGLAAKRAFEAAGRLDYLINAAGVLWFGRDRSVMDIDLDLWNQIVDINLKSVAVTVRSSVPYMRQTGGGAMVHFSSTQSQRGDDKPQDAYQAAKAGVIALSKSFAIQFAADGIRSNVIVPGPTESPMQARWDQDPELKQSTASHIPLGRVGTTQDMADACLFLLSDQASYITGTELVVDGGLLARP